MSGSTNEVKVAEVRDDPIYSPTEFNPQDGKSFTEALSMIKHRRDGIALALEALQPCDLFTWTGPAADSYRFYLRDLRSAFETTDELLDSCVAPITEAQQEWTMWVVQATAAATQANEAQKALKEAKQSGANILVQMVRSAELIGAVAEGNKVLRGIQISLAALAAQLTSLDTQLSDVIFPQPPEGGANTQIFSPARLLHALEGDTEAARALLASINNSNFPLTDVAFRQMLMALSPAEREYVLQHLDLDEAKRMLAGLNDDQLEELLKTADPNLIRFLGAADDSGAISPAQPPGHHHDWIETEFSEHPNADPEILRQGGLGDCHYLAALAAKQQVDPGFMERHIHPNPENGTYTVTLYDKDGKPFEVTVDGRIPGEDGQSSYAQGGPEINAYQIYEKAIAAAHERGQIELPSGNGEGYSKIDGGWAADDWQVITGDEGHKHEPGDITPAQINQQINGSPPEPVVVATQFGSPPNVPPGYEKWYDPDYVEYDANGDPKPHKYLVPGHEYYVIAATDNTITLANPWGQGDQENGTITLTMEEYRALTHTISTGG